MLKMSSLDEQINAYYDDQMKESEVLRFEARMALSDCVRGYANEKCFEFYKITTSINRVKNRIKNLLWVENKVFDKINI